MRTRLLSSILAATAMSAGLALVPSGTATADACNGTYTHCETNQCPQGVFYLNYDPTADHFSGERGVPLVQNEQGDIRDEPYRRYGPRGVRAFHDGSWGFYSTTCFPA
jgi:hypothetical protein